MTEPIDQATKVMSNTDGEDTLRIEKEAIAFADSIEVNSIATHTGLVKGYIAGAKELASLREQKKKDDEEFNRALETIKELEKMYANTHGKLRDLEKEHSDNKANLHRAYKGLERLNELKEQLKQKEDENRELINKIQEEFTDMEYTKWTTMEVIQFLESFKNNLSA